MSDTDATTISEIEAELTATADHLIAPKTDECLLHYLELMLDEFGCQGHRFTQRWGRSPRGRGKRALSWAKRSGRCCCDCEVVMNSLPSLSRPSPYRTALLCPAAIAELNADPWGEESGHCCPPDVHC